MFIYTVKIQDIGCPYEVLDVSCLIDKISFGLGPARDAHKRLVGLDFTG